MRSTDTKIEFYVAPNGSDTNPGTIEAPFAALSRARDAVRELKKAAGEKGLQLPVTVWVRGGKYYPERCFDLTETDSGTAQTPIVYSAYPGETPVISGARRVTGWQPYKGKIFKCEFPEAKGGAIAFRQLFADGERQIRARYPNLEPDAANWNGRWARSKADAAALESSEPYIVWDEPDAFPRSWAKPTQGELFLMPRQTMWGDSALIRIKSIDKEKKTIKLVHGMRSFDINPMYYPKKIYHPENCQFIVENILEELDQPGEWCLDTEDGMLYFWPPVPSQVGGPKDSIDNMEIVIPILKRLVHMEGVSNVRISGFVFTETSGGEPSSHYHDVEGVGAMSPQMGWEYCGETLYLNKCTDCRIENNRIINAGGNGIYLRHHNERNLIRSNEIGYAGANGVVLAGGRYSIYQKLGGTQGIPHPIFNEITDNTIHHIGLIDTYAAGVFLGLGNWNRVAHNDIHDVPHHAVNLGNSRYGRNYIEYNRITRACRVTHDNGAINCWHEMPPEMEPPGHVIRYNFISDTGNDDKSGLGYSITMGIYLDNSVSNCLVEGNIVINTMPNRYGVGILVKGRNNIIENNIVVNPGRHHISVMAHACYPEFATLVSRNIFYDALGGKEAFLDLANQSPLCKVLLQCDNNLFFKKGEDNPLIAKANLGHKTGQDNPLLAKGVRFSDWPRMYGRDEDVYDVNSIVADPLFVDAANGDYRLSPESPALKLGFQPIPFERIGVRKRT